MKAIPSILTLSLLMLGLLLPKAAPSFEIVIDKGVENALPIAVVPFGWNQSANTPPQDVAEIVRQDLVRSGRFNAIPPNDMPTKPTRFDDINFSD